MNEINKTNLNWSDKIFQARLKIVLIEKLTKKIML